MIPVNERPKHIRLTQTNFKNIHYIRCPACGQPMALRQNRQQGNLFYGCVTYPNCRGVRENKVVDEFLDSVLAMQGQAAFSSTLVGKDSDLGLSRRRRAALKAGSMEHGIATSPDIVGSVVKLNTNCPPLMIGDLAIVEGSSAHNLDLRYGGGIIRNIHRMFVSGLDANDTFVSWEIPAGTNYIPGAMLRVVRQDGTTLICRTTTENGVWSSEPIRFHFDLVKEMLSPAAKQIEDEFNGTAPVSHPDDVPEVDYDSDDTDSVMQDVAELFERPVPPPELPLPTGMDALDEFLENFDKEADRKMKGDIQKSLRRSQERAQERKDKAEREGEQAAKEIFDPPKPFRIDDLEINLDGLDMFDV